MAYDLEEQEQLDALRAWWKQNGQIVTMAVGAAFVGLIGYQSWTYYQHQQSLKASAQYEALTQLDIKDVKQVRAVSSQIMENFAGSPYAARAALMAARANYESGDVKSARSQIEWALSHASEDSVKAIAQLQLAALQVEEKKYDDALKTLSDKHEASFDGLFADLKGDILVAQNKPGEAKKAYAEALTKLDEKGRFRRLTEQKLDALGS
jgi:predicted negative regulator of RcsB-dependent stress response